MRSTFTLFVILVLVLGMSCEGQKNDEMKQTEAVETTANTAIDPVCEMKVNKDTAQYTAEYNGQKYYFCMEEHKVAFLENPEAYLTKE
jgi:YHS domain-containing protein